MSSFSYEKKNDKLYIVYKADATEVIDGYALGIILSNPIPGISETSLINDENGRAFTYNITGKISLKELFQKGINDKIYVHILASVTKTLQYCEQYGLSIGNLILNEELIYCKEKDYTIDFICIPTSGFVNSVTSRQVLGEFSNVVINRMEVANNDILEIHNFLVNSIQFDLADFAYRLEQYIKLNNIEVTEQKKESVYEEIEKTKQPKEKELTAENINEKVIVEEAIIDEKKEEVKENIEGAVSETKDKILDIQNKTINCLKNKVADVSKFIGNIKNSAPIKELKQKIVTVSDKKAKNIQDKEEYTEEIRQKVAEQKDEDKRQQELIKEKFENNRLFDSVPEQGGAYGAVGTIGETIIEDCVTGETVDKNFISTAEPYLVRVSTGEKIAIDQSTFKLGRGKKFVDYYVGGNDTISKVHAYITNKANQYFLVDNSSRNHTFLDGKLLKPIEQMKLNHKSKIRLGKEEFVFYLY